MSNKVKSVIVALAVVITFLSGCSLGKKDTLGIDVEIGADNIDPQYLTDKTSELVAINIFEGLIVADDDGAIHPAMAESWHISENGLVYTFTLREDSYWESWKKENNKDTEEIKDPVTAHDFVFGISRLFNSVAPSPHWNNFSAIKNAEKILAGEKDQSTLGIKALENYTLEITLERKDQLFLSKLSGVGALPCNQKFFEESKGRYGTRTALTLSNGRFILSSWSGERIVLTPNPNYYKGENIAFERININIRVDNRLERFNSGATDIAFLTEQDGTKNSNGSIEYEGSTWCIAFNTADRPMNVTPYRQGFAYCINSAELAQMLTDNQKTSTSIFTKDVILGTAWDEKISLQSLGGYNPQKAKDSYSFGLSQITQPEKEKDLILYLPDSVPLNYLKPAQKAWKENLGVTVDIQQLPKDEYFSKLNSRDFDMIVCEVAVGGTNPIIILEEFAYGKTKNILGYDNIIYKDLVDSSYKSESYDQLGIFAKEAENLLLMDSIVVPLYSEKQYIAISKWAETSLIYPLEELVRFCWNDNDK